MGYGIKEMPCKFIFYFISIFISSTKHHSFCSPGAHIGNRLKNKTVNKFLCLWGSQYAIVNIILEELEEDVEQLHRRLVYDSKPHNHTIDE